MSYVTDGEIRRWELAEELVHRAVRRGARYMERRWPGWFTERFELERFDIASGCGCVLGQYYGDVHEYPPDSFFYYANAVEELGLTPDYAALLGFDVPNPNLLERLGLEELYNDSQWYKILQSEWIAEYHFRRAVSLRTQAVEQ